jgi:hypothetical protein
MTPGRTLQAAVWLCFAVLAGTAVPANAQGTAPGTTPSRPVPDANPEKDPKPPVIHPGNPDPGIAVRPPKTGTMPVVPPPGTPGGNPAVIPK